MGTKNNPGAYDCYTKAHPDEPMFVLLARDPSAPTLVEQWAMRRQHEIELGQRPGTDKVKVDEAIACAKAMRDWHHKTRLR